VLVSEETVKVDLGSDYHIGAYFRTVGSEQYYEVPRSQLKRWEAAQTAYEAMQDEIEQVMQEQRERVLAILMEGRTNRPSVVPDAIQKAYENVILQTLKQPPLPRKEQPE
jgi:methionine synthase II (cobalamin-independent)